MGFYLLALRYRPEIRKNLSETFSFLFNTLVIGVSLWKGLDWSLVFLRE